MPAQQLKVGIMTKKVNSTKQSFTVSHTYTSSSNDPFTLKEKCSRHDPVFIVKDLSKNTQYNYC